MAVSLPSSAEPDPGEKLVVIGQGYVGLPLSIRAVECGYAVVGVDLDRSRIEQLALGQSYVEDITAQQVAAALATGRFTPTSDYAQCSDFDVAVITVPTPLREGLPDLSHIRSAGEALARHVTQDSLIILESTTYPGTTEELLRPILEEGSGLRVGVDFELGYSPERIDPGNPQYKFQNIPKVVSGIGDRATKQVATFYESIIDRVVPVSSCKTAELTKLLENTFRHVNIALVNELAMFAHDLGIDVWEAIDASSTKPFGYMRFTPGPGVGGHCLPVDPSYLSWQVKRQLGRSFRFVELANDVNDHMPDYVVRRAQALLNDRARPVHGANIVLVGMAYKKNTGDVRESPTTRVAQLLVDMGADVTYVDAHVTELACPGLRRADSLNDALVTDPDLVVLLTDHDGVDYKRLSRCRLVLDCKHRLPVSANVSSL